MMRLKNSIERMNEKTMERDLSLYAIILTRANENKNGEYNAENHFESREGLCNDLVQMGFFKKSETAPSMYVITDKGKKLATQINAELPPI